MFPPIVQEAMKLLIECYQFDDRLIDAARLVFDLLKDEHPEEGPDEKTMAFYHTHFRPHIDAIHDEIANVLKNKLEDRALDASYNGRTGL